MKQFSLWILIVVLWAIPCSSVHADTTVNGILAAVVKQCVADKLPSTMPCVAVDFVAKHYICRLSDGLLLKTSKLASPGVGVAGDWAQVVVMPLDAKFKSATQGANWLMHRNGGKWSLAAIDEGVGYSKDGLKKAQVPADVIRILNLQTAE